MSATLTASSAALTWLFISASSGGSANTGTTMLRAGNSAPTTGNGAETDPAVAHVAQAAGRVFQRRVGSLSGRFHAL